MLGIPKGLLAFFLLVTLLGSSLSIANNFIQHNDILYSDNNGLLLNKEYRLLKSVVPIAYDIKFHEINFSSFTFKGTVKINARIIEDTKEIELHLGNLTAYVTSLINLADNRRLNVAAMSYNRTTEKFSIFLSEYLQPSEQISIQLIFNGTLRDDMIGFYKSSYIDDYGEERWLAATQFESTYARHAFPCFDEPALKSTFNISIFRPEGYSCLSNMALKVVGNWCIFSESVVMSTYLVAFVISDFSSLAKDDSSLRIWSRPNALKQTLFSSSIGTAALAYFEDLFNEPYQLPKIDMVAVPDFASGAMENWGLITYRETSLLYDEVESSTAVQQSIAAVVVHECSHMWFGNLVTPEWWSYLWLSEAFARYYQYMAMHKIESSWKMNQQFLVEQYQVALSTDSLENSVPMTRAVSSQAEIRKMGGIITYSKGASIVRMMEHTFGTDIFNSAIRAYLKDRKYKSAMPHDLWKALQKRIDANQHSKFNLSVATIMKTWTDQPGFPYITVTIKRDCIKFSQQRFLLQNQNTVPSDSTWWVPITWTLSSQTNSTSQLTKPVYWLSQRNAEIPNKNKDEDWMIINVQSIGFYRVQYDKDTWKKIIHVLKSDNFEKIHELNRAAIVDDLLNLARAGILDYEIALQGLQYLKRETNYLPFKSVFSGLDYLIRRFSTSPDYDIFKKYAMSLFANIYNKIGFDDDLADDQFTILLRQTINNRACKLEHPECIEKSQTYFSEWRNKNIPISKNQRSVAYCNAIKYGSTADWEFLWKKYKSSNVATEQVNILYALGCSRDTKILEKYLLIALTGFKNSYIRKQDITNLFSGIYTKDEQGAEFVIDFIEKYNKNIFKYFNSFDEIGNFIMGALQWYPTEKLIHKVGKLLNNNETYLNSIKPSIEKTLKIANFELDWFNKYSPIIINSIASDECHTAYQLPDNIIPSAYTIHLAPFIIPNNFTFNGIVKIFAKVNKSTRKIVLHADQLTINDLKVYQFNEENDFSHQLAVLNVSQMEKYHFLTIIMEKPIKTGTNISINIAYTGVLNTDMRGFYRSSYTRNNKTRWLAATHLEPVAARKVFPCFDEPALKSTFDISVAVPKYYTAISNMPVKSQSATGIWKFHQTPVMSTYLVAVVVSDFQYQQHTIDDRVYGVWASPPMAQYLSYSLEVMQPIIEFLETRLCISYGLPKLDMVALPDFVSGAMENWGLITYRETNMLYDGGESSSITSKQAVHNVIAHEIAHQWFGNLVSPLRWDYLWLSEGFARYFQYHAHSDAEALWNLETQFVVDHLQTSFSLDASGSTHPVTHKVYSPSEIKAIFDKISYGKAGSLIRMMEKLVGSDTFYDALNHYLQDRQYSTGTPQALFSAFQHEIKPNSATKFNVTKVMNSWTRQSGFPVVNVAFKNNKATLTQTRFYLRPVINETSKTAWSIPINWATRSNPNFKNTQNVVWLEKKSKSIQITNLNSDDWVIFNIQQTGYYRVNYDTTMWRRIIDALNSSEYSLIHEINRASLIDDMLNLGRAGYLDYDIVFAGLRYLANETAYAPWKAAHNGLAYLTQRFVNRPEIYDSYRIYVLSLLEPHFKRLGFVDRFREPYADTLLRKLVLEFLCSLGHTMCVKESIRLFHKEQHEPSYKVPANQCSFVYCTAIRHGTARDWNYLWTKFEKSNYAEENLVILSALACSENSTKLETLLYKTITAGNQIRLQDAKKVFINIIDSSVIGVKTALTFMSSNYLKIHKYFNDDSIMKNIFNSISKRLPTNNMFIQFDHFVTNITKYKPSMSKSLQSSLKRAKYELNWYKERASRIIVCMEKYDYDSNYRLPTFASPEHYDIYLKPYLEEENFKFTGSVAIDINIKIDTFKIVLHSDKLIMQKIYASDNSYEILSYSHNEITNILTIYFKKIINAGRRIKLNFDYRGHLRDDMSGFYRSSYTDENGQKKWIATTQFEPTYARKAFPCFDEPSFKSKFTVHIAKPTGYRTLSNMGSSPTESIDANDQVWDDYETTVKMSPYTLAFVVSDFKKYPETKSKLSVWSKSQLTNYMEYSYDVGQKALQILENFTQVSYPLKEMNFVAVPDFNKGAMENWGLVTFREYGLTYDAQETSASFKRYVNIIISHELVHMWFGNLVTCEWWDFTWLNEGFAEYLAYLITDTIEPTWQVLQEFVIKNTHAALDVDSSQNSHPMNNHVNTQSQIEKAFDKIAYAKSAAVLRMLHHTFGSKIFFQALKNYLNNYKYRTARPEYIINEFQAAIDAEEIELPGGLEVDASTFINSWTSQAGYPIVNATRVGNTVFFSQERFLTTSSNESDKKKIYWIPITYTTESESDFQNTVPRFWLGNEEKQILLRPTDTWFVVNIQECGFYRINYNVENWHRLTAILNSEKFSNIEVVNRAQILDDSFNLARAGYLDYEIVLDITKYLIRETNYLSWKSLFNGLNYLSQRIEGQADTKRLYARYILSLVNNIYAELGFEEDLETDSTATQLNRELILSVACKYGHSDCIKQSKIYFAKSTVSPNIANVVYCTAIEHGSSNDWSILWNKYLKSKLSTQNLAILKGLGCSKNSTLIRRYLDLVISSDSKIRRQDIQTVLFTIYGSGDVGLQTAITYFASNILKLYTYFGNWEEIGSLFTNMAAYISSSAQISLLEKLSNLGFAFEIQSSLKTTIKIAKFNLNWSNQYSGKINAWLSKNYIHHTNDMTKLNSFNRRENLY